MCRGNGKGQTWKGLHSACFVNSGFFPQLSSESFHLLRWPRALGPLSADLEGRVGGPPTLLTIYFFHIPSHFVFLFVYFLLFILSLPSVFIWPL